MALTDKRQAFVDAYVQTWNATEAARQAGYSEVSARVTGHRLLTDANVQEEIQRRVSERAMSKDEVLIRLAEMARGSMDDFTTFWDGVSLPKLDLAKAQKAGKLGLVKKLKYGKDGEIEFELYDAQAALVQLGKAHRVFVERNEVSGPNGGDIPVKAKHAIDPDSAETIFGILASIGAVESASGDAEDDEVHTASAIE